jgi:hypothetical protein
MGGTPIASVQFDAQVIGILNPCRYAESVQISFEILQEFISQGYCLRRFQMDMGSNPGFLDT